MFAMLFNKKSHQDEHQHTHTCFVFLLENIKFMSAQSFEMQTHKNIFSCDNIVFQQTQTLLPCLSPVCVDNKQSDMCSVTVFWDKHQLPEAEILIRGHGVFILALEAH